jgi:type VI secretion system protein ImpF
MAAPGTERTVRFSVIDRLVDEEPRLGADAPITWAESVRRLKGSVLRDLEWLLNTRRQIEPAPAIYAEVQRSLYHYGLPDVSSVSRDSAPALRILIQQMEECIRTFEPRLDNVRVLATPQAGAEQRELRFVIEAMLRMEPNPERVVFDTVLETVRGEFRVAPALDA